MAEKIVRIFVSEDQLAEVVGPDGRPGSSLVPGGRKGKAIEIQSGDVVIIHTDNENVGRGNELKVTVS